MIEPNVTEETVRTMPTSQLIATLAMVVADAALEASLRRALGEHMPVAKLRVDEALESLGAQIIRDEIDRRMPVPT